MTEVNRPLTDSEKSHLRPFYNHRIAMQPPDADILDCPRVQFVVNVDWLPHIVGALNTLDQCDAWTTDVDRARSEILKLIARTCESIMKLRQNPENTCELQVSYDCGETWSTAFNYRLCQPPKSMTVSDGASAQVEINTTMNIYEGDITNISNNWYYGDEYDGDRDAAMCWAARQFVVMVCELQIQQIRDEDQDERDALKFAGDAQEIIGGIVGVAVGLGFAPAWAAVGAIALAVGALATNVYAQQYSSDISYWQDEDERERVACAIFCAMRGSTPTYASWSSALDGLDGDMAEMTHEFMQSEEVFVEWLKLFADMVEISKTGVDLGCPCECAPWEAIFDFTIDSGGFVQAEGHNHKYFGEWLSTQGHKQTVDSESGTVTGNCSVVPFGVAGTLTYFLIRYDLDRSGAWDGTGDKNNNQHIRTDVDDALSIRTLQTQPASIAEEGTNVTWTWQGNSSFAADEYVGWQMLTGVKYDGDGTEKGSIRIYQAVLRGRGAEKPVWAEWL